MFCQSQGGNGPVTFPLRKEAGRALAVSWRELCGIQSRWQENEKEITNGCNRGRNKTDEHA
jgi:hypothetical protein